MSAEATSQPSDITKLLNDIRSEVCTSRTEILSEFKTLKSTLQAHEVKLQDVGDSLTDVDTQVVTLERLRSGARQREDEVEAGGPREPFQTE